MHPVFRCLSRRGGCCRRSRNGGRPRHRYGSAPCRGRRVAHTPRRTSGKLRAQASRAALAISTLKAVCLERTFPVTSHTSAQSRSSLMQRASICRSSSPRQASAQAVQAWAQSKQASMHSTSAFASTAGSLGFVSIIRRAWVTSRLLSLFVMLRSGKRLAPRVPLLEPTPHLFDLPRLIVYDPPGEIPYCGVVAFGQGDLGHLDGR